MSDFARRLLYLPEQASSFAPEVDALHFFVISVTMFGATAVFATALFFTWRYRRREETERTAPVRTPLALEAAVVVGLLGLFLFFWVLGYQQYLRMRAPPSDALEIYVTAKKWTWKFAYPDGRRTNDLLVVPAGRAVKLIMTSRDVIHSFFGPAFRTKQDVLPGSYTTLWFDVRKPGEYPIYCAEYCGESHSRMLARVVALAPAEWEAWLDEEAGSQRPTLAERGLEVAARRGCLSCHTVDGSRHLGPSFAGLFGRDETLADGRTVRVDEAFLTRSMMEPMAEIAAGYPPIMPTYQGQLDPAEIAALLELIKSLRWPLAEGEAR